jgi:hypothetical protein
MLVPGAEGATSARIVDIRHHRALACNYPTSRKWIEPKFSHVRSLSNEMVATRLVVPAKSLA